MKIVRKVCEGEKGAVQVKYLYNVQLTNSVGCGIIWEKEGVWNVQ